VVLFGRRAVIMLRWRVNTRINLPSALLRRLQSTPRIGPTAPIDRHHKCGSREILFRTD
jgi:hypothetical protein